MKPLFYIIALLSIPCLHTYGQVKMTISDPTPVHPSAMLELSDNTTGMLITRMTKAQCEAIDDPATGLVVYVTTAPGGSHYYDGENWTRTGEYSSLSIGQAYQGGKYSG